MELGAGMLPYGYEMRARTGAKNFVVEPFYADRQEIAQLDCWNPVISES